jgi:hypothetical protein
VDGGEIEKKNSSRDFKNLKSKKMKYCCGIADGSNHHQASWGYKMLNISLHVNEKTHILSQHLYSSNAENYESDWSEQQRKMRLIRQIMPQENNIIIEDSIGDDAKRIKFYSEEMNCNFIIRGQNKRIYEVDFHGELIPMRLSEIGENIEYDEQKLRSYFDKKTQKDVTSKIGVIPVQHKDLKDKNNKKLELNLVLVKSETYDVPMAFLTNLNPKNSEEAWKIFFWYKKRWEVEKNYRDIKQKFKLESALIRDYKAWQTLVVLTALAWELTQEMALDAKSFLADFYLFFKDWLQKKQQKIITHLNLLDFLREFECFRFSPISHRIFSAKIFLHRFQKDKNQLSLIDFRKNW